MGCKNANWKKYNVNSDKSGSQEVLVKFTGWSHATFKDSLGR